MGFYCFIQQGSLVHVLHKVTSGIRVVHYNNHNLHVNDIHLCMVLQERSILLRKWFDLITQHKEDLAKLITAECV